MPWGRPSPFLLARVPPPWKTWLRRAALAYLGRRERRRFESRSVIWLLAHMRSGSTLLMHLLCSHPEILGAGERNATYASRYDLRRLSIDVAYARREFLRDYRYVADQINHNRFLTSLNLLNHPRVYKVFLVREPQATLASMAEVLGRFYGMTLEEAVEYYLDRLPALARYARHVSDRDSSFFLTYDDLVKRPRRVLEGLQAFLHLRTSLSESYRTFDFTGRSGDPSERIRSGRILSDLPPRRLDLEPRRRKRVQETFSSCTRGLEECCRVVNRI